MEAKHTPGPWEWDKGAPHILNAPHAFGHPSGISDKSPILMLRKAARTKVSEANAHLIAAAPALLAACKAMDESIWTRVEGCDMPGCGVCKENKELKKQLRAAIALAEKGE